MTKLPGAMVIIDVNHESNAVKEARKLGIPTVCLIDTDSDPDFADIPIPGNDDAMRAIEVIMQSLCAAVAEGKTARAQQQQAEGEGEAEGGEASPRRRSKRAQFRAERDPAAAAEADHQGGTAGGESGSPAEAVPAGQAEPAREAAS